MRYYKFKVMHPNVSSDEVLKIEANTLDDAKKELSSRLNICKIFLSHIGTDEIDYVSDHERMFNDVRIVDVSNDINRNPISSHQSEEILDYRISASDTSYSWILNTSL